MSNDKTHTAKEAFSNQEPVKITVTPEFRDAFRKKYCNQEPVKTAFDPATREAYRKLMEGKS